MPSIVAEHSAARSGVPESTLPLPSLVVYQAFSTSPGPVVFTSFTALRFTSTGKSKTAWRINVQSPPRSCLATLPGFTGASRMGGWRHVFLALFFLALFLFCVVVGACPVIRSIISRRWPEAFGQNALSLAGLFVIFRGVNQRRAESLGHPPANRLRQVPGGYQRTCRHTNHE